MHKHTYADIHTYMHIHIQHIRNTQTTPSDLGSTLPLYAQRTLIVCCIVTLHQRSNEAVHYSYSTRALHNRPPLTAPQHAVCLPAGSPYLSHVRYYWTGLVPRPTGGVRCGMQQRQGCTGGCVAHRVPVVAQAPRLSAAGRLSWGGRRHGGLGVPPLAVRGVGCVRCSAVLLASA